MVSVFIVVTVMELSSSAAFTLSIYNGNLLYCFSRCNHSFIVLPCTCILYNILSLLFKSITADCLAQVQNL